MAAGDLMANRALHSDAYKEAKETASAVRNMSRPRILMVDNDKAFLRFLRLNLPEEWYLRTAQDPASALRCLAADTFHLVTFDIAIRPAGGLYFLQQIRLLAPGVKAIMTSDLPISVQSADSLGSRGCAFLTKPIDRGALDRVIQALLVSPGVRSIKQS